MTHSTSEKLADLALGTAVLGAAVYVLKTPSLRRMAWRLAVIGVTRTVPSWFRQEVRRAWDESGRTRSASDPIIVRTAAGSAEPAPRTSSAASRP
jgi:hypothetical protein